MGCLYRIDLVVLKGELMHANKRLCFCYCGNAKKKLLSSCTSMY